MSIYLTSSWQVDRLIYMETRFALDENNQYRWSGVVNPATVSIDCNKAKYSKLVKAVVAFVGARLFSEKPITVEIIWENSTNKHGGEGCASTSQDGSHAQVGVFVKKIEGNTQSLVNLVSHELAHVWQRRNGWGSGNPDIPHHERPEEIHANKLGQLLGNEFIIRHGAEFGITPQAWLNGPKYFSTIVDALYISTPQNN